MNLPTITDDRFYRHFPTFADYARFCVGTGKCGNEDEDNSWTFGRHWKNRTRLIAAMESGTAEPAVLEIVQRLRVTAGDIMRNAEGPSKRRRQVWSDQGDEIDPDRMNAGRDRAWRATQIGRPSPVVRILAMFDCNGTCSTERFGAAAASVALAADALATAGYSFEVWAIQHGNSSSATWGNRYHTVTACIKGAGEPLDIQRVASVYTIGAIRYFGFGLIRNDFSTTNMGSCRTPDRATLALCSATGSIRPEDFTNNPTDEEIVERALSLIPTAEAAAA